MPGTIAEYESEEDAGGASQSVHPESYSSGLEGGLIMIVDRLAWATSARAVLEGAGHRVIELGALKDALEVFAGPAAGAIDAVLLAADADGPSTLEVLSEMRAFHPGVPVVVLSAAGSIDEAVAVMKHGAIDYARYADGPDRLLLALGGALARRTRSSAPSGEVSRLLHERGIVAMTAATRALYETAYRIRDSKVPVMLIGESGTGKEVLTRFLHAIGLRKKGPFIALNCAAIPTDLVESELFGHERGAFTGAAQSYAGRFEEANGGTLFLDEVGELSLGAQAKLLRALQEYEVTRIGGATRKVDIRVVVATNRDLAEEVVARRFRSDLFYRLDVITLRALPLRERVEEIAVLSEIILQRFTLGEGVPPRALSADAIALLEQYSWPGNIRELENVLKRSVLLGSSQVITPADLIFSRSPAHSRSPPAETAGGQRIIEQPAAELSPEESLEHHADVMRRALEEAKGNVSMAAKILGISRATFYRHAKRCSLIPGAPSVR
jgi:DNA-binding NtrC family response regulator